MQVSEQPPAVAVIVAVPAPVAVTTPLTTIATPLSSDDHVTVLSVAFSGSTVAVSSISPPTSKATLSLSSETPVTATRPGFTVMVYSFVFERSSKKYPAGAVSVNF